MLMMKRFGKAAIFSCFLLLLTGCGKPMESHAHADVTLGAWVADWDMASGMAEREKMGGKLSSLSYFAAVFENDGRLSVPKEIPQAKGKAAKVAGQETYLTIVNDWKNDKGKLVEKDTVILGKVLHDKETRAAHIEEILALAQQGGYDGIEIDYERVGKEKPLMTKYIAFLYEMQEAAAAKGIKLRSILEPGMDYGLGFPEGPEYVVMFYNLYGTHSGPGPKADGAFIEKTIGRMQALPGKKAAAFATGGCVWEKFGLLRRERKSSKFLTEGEAVALQKKYKAKPERDKESAALSFDYEDKKDGKTYEVWYADSETLKAWITLAADKGIPSVMIWRLGDNVTISDVE